MPTVAQPTDGDDPSQGPSQADRIYELARELYRAGVDQSGTPFLVKREGPMLAFGLSAGRGSFRSEMAQAYRDRTGRTPTSTAMSSALEALEGHALRQERESVFLRVGRHEDAIIVDLGDASGACIRVARQGWEVLERSPILFRRTPTTGALPRPEPGGNLDELVGLFNVPDARRDELLGWLVATFIPDIEHAGLAIVGEHGTAKSSALRLIVQLTDPSPADSRPLPSNPTEWAVAANSSWILSFDNVSGIRPSMSDAMCRAITGDSFVARRLHTNSDLVVLTFRRVILLNGVALGNLRGDLADRLDIMELEVLPPGRRISRKELEERVAERKPYLVGALMDALAGVLEAWPHIALDDPPRLADFARALAAFDQATGRHSLDQYRRGIDDAAQAVADGDPVARLMMKLADATGDWAGTATDALENIPADSRSPFPRGPRSMGEAIRRAAPTMRALGYGVTQRRASGGNRDRTWMITAPGGAAQRAAEPASASSRLARLRDDRDRRDEPRLIARLSVVRATCAAGHRVRVATSRLGQPCVRRSCGLPVHEIATSTDSPSPEEP